MYPTTQSHLASVCDGAQITISDWSVSSASAAGGWDATAGNVSTVKRLLESVLVSTMAEKWRPPRQGATGKPFRPQTCIVWWIAIGANDGEARTPCIGDGVVQ